MIGLQHYLTLSAMLFVLSIVGIVINRRNLILLLMCIELMLLAVNFNFIAFSPFSRFTLLLQSQIFGHKGILSSDALRDLHRSPAGQ